MLFTILMISTLIHTSANAFQIKPCIEPWIRFTIVLFICAGMQNIGGLKNVCLLGIFNFNLEAALKD